MAKAEKYRIEFKSADNLDFKISFFYEGYTGSIINLTGGSRPFVMREFNTNEDIFKPIRPMMAEIEILASASGVNIDNFYASNDTDIEVKFYLTSNVTPYWIGYLLQDDFQEVWEDTNHFIILRASEGFGFLKNIQFGTGGNEVQGRITPFDAISYCLENTVLPIEFNTRYYVYNSLYHHSVANSTTASMLEQCYIDAKTFQQDGIIYDDKYTALEKINLSFGQTIFMKDADWFIMRIEDLYKPYTENLIGYSWWRATPSYLVGRYDLTISETSSIKPVSPSMLRYLIKKTKYDQASYTYENHNETIVNESFTRGTYLTTDNLSKVYTLDSWDIYYGAPGSTTPATGSLRMYEQYTDGTFTAIVDKYVVVPLNNYISSQYFYVNASDYIDFSVDLKVTTNPSLNIMRAGYVILESSTGVVYWLSESGKWTSAASVSAALDMGISDLSGNNIVATQWNTFEVQSDPIPVGGKIKVYFSCLVTQGNQIVKNLKVQVNRYSIELINQKKITGSFSKYTKTETVDKDQDIEIYLDDNYNANQKGSITLNTTNQFTPRRWYRKRFTGESYGFRKQHAIARWEHNKFNRSKIDANFFGLRQSSALIGLHNTIRFTDDDPNKVYAILNMREIDFSAATWSATLIEVHDSTRDNLTATQSFNANFDQKLYPNSQQFGVVVVTNGGFSVQGGRNIVYEASTTLNKIIDCDISGTASSKTTYPQTMTLNLKLNTTVLSTFSFSVTAANQSFSYNMGVGTTTIVTGDVITLEFTGDVECTIDGGSIQIDSLIQTQSFDTYTEGYVIK